MEFGQRVCQIATFRALTPEALSRAAILSACATQCRLALANQALMNECDGSRLQACEPLTLIRERCSDRSHQQISRAQEVAAIASWDRRRGNFRRCDADHIPESEQV
jgi:hypothetical protein